MRRDFNSQKKKKISFCQISGCSIKYAWHLCSLTWVAKWFWQSKPRQVCPSGGWEGKWMEPSLPAGHINRGFVWPARSVYQLMKHHALWVEVEYSTCLFHTSCSLKYRALLFPPRREKKKKKRPDETVQLSGGEATGMTTPVTTPPTQSWSGTVFKKEKQGTELSCSHRT